MTTLNWKTSTRSNEGNCVEVATPTPTVMVRDSKDRQGPALAFSAGQWVNFVQGTKAGKFDA
ncbi:DUF397 domain-containing protein [Micromonospora foliorum]|uniref:DUF397 domain-containing protein n=1 Tax=Micromonospora foliorum TaxID=2911210 RepID=UPI001EE8C8D3|nr:DUF397 domain-containing protein [Micromonospora foliorum]MCG5439881.1 DUF397 domain-containing protein [Micromonospora foliorum]